MNGVVITNEVKLYHGIAVSLRICNDCFIGPFAIVVNSKAPILRPFVVIVKRLLVLPVESVRMILGSILDRLPG